LRIKTTALTVFAFGRCYHRTNGRQKYRAMYIVADELARGAIWPALP